MPELDLFLLFVRPLNLAGIQYMIGGSVAAMFYGEPRLTLDIDLIVFLTENNLRQLSGIFPGPIFYTPPIETILTESKREQGGHFNIIHVATGFKADMYPGGQDELNAWGFTKRQPIHFENDTVIVAPPEYVIVRKLEYFREGGSDKHVRDIQSYHFPQLNGRMSQGVMFA